MIQICNESEGLVGYNPLFFLPSPSTKTVIISIITFFVLILDAFIITPLRAALQGIVILFCRAYAAFDRLFVCIFIQ